MRLAFAAHLTWMSSSTPTACEGFTIKPIKQIVYQQCSDQERETNAHNIAVHGEVAPGLLNFSFFFCLCSYHSIYYINVCQCSVSVRIEADELLTYMAV